MSAETKRVIVKKNLKLGKKNIFESKEKQT